MRNETFRKNLSLLVVLVFLLTTAGPAVFAASTSVVFKDPPTYTAGQTNAIGLKPLHLEIATPQALKLTITSGTAISKFFLTRDQNTTDSAAKSIDLQVPTGSALTWTATAYLGITSGSALSANDSIKIIATDTDGNEIGHTIITVPGSGGGGGGGGGGGHFTTPAKPSEKPKTPAKPDAGTISKFYDVKPTDWFYADVEFVLKRGLFQGVSATSFAPRMPMSRGMIVTALGRLDGVNVSAGTSSSFGDVAAGQYYTAYVEWAKSNGIVTGVGANSFAPDRDVSRQDFAVILVRYADFAKKPLHTTRQPITFTDETQIAGYAKSAIQKLYGSAIVNGMGGNVFAPDRSATRAEVAAMLHRFVEATE